jgi:hypothetical protein
LNVLGGKIRMIGRDRAVDQANGDVGRTSAHLHQSPKANDI